MFRAIGWERMVRQQSMQMDFVGLVWEPVKQNSIYMVEIIRRMWIRLTGTTIATKYIITCNGGKVIVNLCFEIKGAVSE